MAVCKGVYLRLFLWFIRANPASGSLSLTVCVHKECACYCKYVKSAMWKICALLLFRYVSKSESSSLPCKQSLCNISPLYRTKDPQGVTGWRLGCWVNNFIPLYADPCINAIVAGFNEITTIFIPYRKAKKLGLIECLRKFRFSKSVIENRPFFLFRCFCCESALFQNG